MASDGRPRRDGASPAASTRSRRRAAAGRPPFEDSEPKPAARSVGKALDRASVAESVSDAGTDLNYDPALAGELNLENGFDQTVRLTMNGRPVGNARWRLGDGGAEGVVQLIELTIDLSLRRHGHGRRVLSAVIAQIKAAHLATGIRPRRIWAAIPQKTHVGGRAFLTACGFHHVGTQSGLFRDQDLLTYVLSLD